MHQDPERHRVRVGTAVLGVVWGVVGLLIALSALGNVNADARLLVGAASVLFPLAALAAALFAVHDRLRVAGGLLVISVATPTYFAWALNLPALVVGILLVSGTIPRRRPAMEPARLRVPPPRPR